MTKLAEALVDCDEDTVLDLVRERVKSGAAVPDIIAECNEGMSELGNRFEEGDAFIPDLMFAGMIMKKVTEELASLVQASEDVGNRKKMIIGTVKNDIHDIGKNLTAMIFQGSGFEVIDLGTDVAPESFVAAIKEHQPDIVGLSLLLTTCRPSVRNTVKAIQEANLRESVKICVGGAAADPILAQETGCDYYGAGAIDTLKWAKGLG
jgi:5-methyltetrahydrofolate--homocysteine methyltransferase